jgi:catechol 2,3-dioxygenase-like lactoylglutathione lyase family enzyme
MIKIDHIDHVALAVRDLKRSRQWYYECQDHHIAHSIYFSDPDEHRLELTTYEF